MATRIAIIEDESFLRDILVKKFTQEGYVVSPAADGATGLALLLEKPQDVVLLDILMPKMNGYEVLQTLSERHFTTPIIIISNSGQPVEVDKAMNLGATDFVVKANITPEEVVRKVRDLLERKTGKKPVTMSVPTRTHKAEAVIAGEGRRLLIVEDDQFLRELMITKFTRDGFTVSAAVDGKEALDLVHRELPELILLDVILPGLDGFSVLKEVRASANPKIAKAPVVMLSNLGQDSDVQKGLELGANDYLIKSNLTIDEIIKKIKKYLR